MKNKSIYEPKNNREWFLTYLFNDPDFIADKDRIIGDIRTVAGKEVASVMFLVASPKYTLSQQLKEMSKNRIANLLSVLHPREPELQYDPNSPAAKIIQDIQNVANKFHVSIATVEQGLRYSSLMPGSAFRNIPIVSIEDDQVVIKLKPNMRLEDIQSIYPEIMELQSKLKGYTKRNRSRVRPDLVYAIYKARLQSKSFREIYRLYESGELPGYGGGATITGEDNLARTYRRSKPDV